MKIKSIYKKYFTQQYFRNKVLCRWFRFAQLAKGKSLGRSKPETNSYEQALATHCVGFLLYPSSAELKRKEAEKKRREDEAKVFMEAETVVISPQPEKVRKQKKEDPAAELVPARAW